MKSVRVCAAVLVAFVTLQCQGVDTPEPSGQSDVDAGAGAPSGSAGAGGGGGSRPDAGSGGRGGATTGAAGSTGAGGQRPVPDAGTVSSEPACVWPTAASVQSVSATIRVSGTMDGGMRRYVATTALGDGTQAEGQKPVFQLANGATLQNVIVGIPGADGIHCSGSCTLKNVWWEDVGEDALTSEGAASSTMVTVDGGGAKLASDKIFQHNGGGTMSISSFCASSFGKIYRSCGNCSTQYARHLIMQNISVTLPGSEIAGINVNYGDTAQFHNIYVHGGSLTICGEYTGNDTGAEPPKVRSGPDGATCMYTPATDVISVR